MDWNLSTEVFMKKIAIAAISLIMAGCGASASIDMNNVKSTNNKQTKAPLKLIVDGQAVLPLFRPSIRVIFSMCLLEC